MAKLLTRTSSFLAQVREELKQAAWPARDEVIGSCIVVFVGVFLLAVFISLCDVVLSKAAQIFFR